MQKLNEMRARGQVQFDSRDLLPELQKEHPGLFPQPQTLAGSLTPIKEVTRTGRNRWRILPGTGKVEASVASGISNEEEYIKQLLKRDPTPLGVGYKVSDKTLEGGERPDLLLEAEDGQISFVEIEDHDFEPNHHVGQIVSYIEAVEKLNNGKPGRGIILYSDMIPKERIQKIRSRLRRFSDILDFRVYTVSLSINAV